jgi:translocation and assembly module TamB
MLNNQLQEIKPKSLPIRVNSHLLLDIGDDVQIDAFGLNAKLKGQLFVIQSKQGLGLNGQMLIPEGRFHAYGQDLIIKKGELNFAGPVDQPQLNIEAIRNPNLVANNVTAGIRVTGLADKPTVTLFSDPSMSDQEILSYILRGEGLDNGEQSENDMMTAILIGLGTAQSGKYVGHLGEAFGIKDLSLDTQGSGNNSQVVVSGYILPRLQVKYGIGLFDSLATFTLRYRLMPKLYIEAISGLAQSVDLLYQFEF